jgi:ABC-type lipoprotein export system ATPase subunit
MALLDAAMMHIHLNEVCSSDNLKCFSLDIEINGCTVIYDPGEHISASILATLVGVDDIDAGDVLIDGISFDDYFLQHRLISTFAHVFDEGIMLSNLTIRENLLLPWKIRFPNEDITTFNGELNAWMKSLELNSDINLRPAFVSPAHKKFFGFIRGVMLKPRLLLIDDPYYLFNKTERNLIFRFLYSLNGAQEMLIASADDDFLGDIATDVIDLSTIN